MSFAKANAFFARRSLWVNPRNFANRIVKISHLDVGDASF